MTPLHHRQAPFIFWVSLARFPGSAYFIDITFVAIAQTPEQARAPSQRNAFQIQLVFGVPVSCGQSIFSTDVRQPSPAFMVHLNRGLPLWMQLFLTVGKKKCTGLGKQA